MSIAQTLKNNPVLTLNQLKQMFQLQDQINSQVNPNWKTAQQSWLTAIFVESAEAIESYGYKWWKKQTPDMDNVRLELVDIWHFLMSHTMAIHHNNPDFDFAEIHEAMSEDDNERIGFNSFMIILNAQLIDGEDYDAYMSFSSLCDITELSWDELYRTYIGKNALNSFRASNGYKEGTYIKIWDAENHEDNYFLMEYLKTIDLTQVESLYDNAYNYLQSTYRTVQTN